ncbi:Urm1-domain-containing protein [Xylariaceae sp. FL1651]|nr:Urm1-domain-containing protein [Xylariaceae sp. FL1651]
MAAATTMTTTTGTVAAMATETANINANAPEVSIVVEFTGGLEMLFSDQRRHVLSIPATDKNNKAVTISYLIDYLSDNVMKDTRKELFVLDDHLRPGILVLINDADWELEGEEAYEIQNGDNILFVSTLHGG